MDKEKMVLYLGYCALILIAIYFTYGILKVSGEGLASLGYENNFIREGFSDKQKESSEKQIKSLLSMLKDRTGKTVEDRQQKIDTINDIPEYEELVELYKSYVDSNLRNMVQDGVTSGKIEGNLKKLGEQKLLLDLLNDYTL
jgi:hypothetical protein